MHSLCWDVWQAPLGGEDVANVWHHGGRGDLGLLEFSSIDLQYRNSSKLVIIHGVNCLRKRKMVKTFKSYIYFLWFWKLGKVALPARIHRLSHFLFLPLLSPEWGDVSSLLHNLESKIKYYTLCSFRLFFQSYSLQTCSLLWEVAKLTYICPLDYQEYLLRKPMQREVPFSFWAQ